MTEPGDALTPPAENAAKKTSGSRLKPIMYGALIILCLAALAAAAWFGKLPLAVSGPSSTVAVPSSVPEATSPLLPSAADEHVSTGAQDDQTSRANERLDALTARVEKLEQARSSSGKEDAGKTAQAAEEEVARLRNDLTSM